MTQIVARKDPALLDGVPPVEEAPTYGEAAITQCVIVLKLP
jgi:hypothetical protein